MVDTAIYCSGHPSCMNLLPRLLAVLSASSEITPEVGTTLSKTMSLPRTMTPKVWLIQEFKNLVIPAQWEATIKDNFASDLQWLSEFVITTSMSFNFFFCPVLFSSLPFTSINLRETPMNILHPKLHLQMGFLGNADWDIWYNEWSGNIGTQTDFEVRSFAAWLVMRAYHLSYHCVGSWYKWQTNS